MFSSAKTLAKSVLPAPVLLRTRSVIDPLRHPKRGLEPVYPSMRDLPYKLSLATAWPGSYLSKLPDRYYGHYPKYVAGGGQMRFGDLSKFTRKNRLNTADLSRFYFFNLILDQVLKEQLAGDLAELGVYKGNTAFLLTKLANLLGRMVYLFDTFEGFSSNDLCGIDANKLPEFADTSLASVRALIGVVPIPDKSGTVVIRKLCNVLAGNSNTEAVSRKEMHMKRP